MLIPTTEMHKELDEVQKQLIKTEHDVHFISSLVEALDKERVALTTALENIELRLVRLEQGVWKRGN